MKHKLIFFLKARSHKYIKKEGTGKTAKYTYANQAPKLNPADAAVAQADKFWGSAMGFKRGMYSMTDVRDPTLLAAAKMRYLEHAAQAGLKLPAGTLESARDALHSAEEKAGGLVGWVKLDREKSEPMLLMPGNPGYDRAKARRALVNKHQSILADMKSKGVNSVNQFRQYVNAEANKVGVGKNESFHTAMVRLWGDDIAMQFMRLLEVHSWKGEGLEKAMDTSKLHKETVQVRGKTGTHQSTRWKGTGKKPSEKQMPGGVDPNKRYQTLRRLAAESGKAHSESDVKAIYARRPPGKGEPMPIASVDDFDLLATKMRFTMISAGRNPDVPGEKDLSEMEVHGRTQRLRKELVKRGFVFTPCKGQYGVPEDSFMVMVHDADRKEAMELGETFNQQSVVFTEAGHNELIHTTGEKKGKTDMAGEGYQFVPGAEDYYTDIVIGGETKRFTLNLDVLKKALVGLFNIVRRIK